MSEMENVGILKQIVSNAGNKKWQVGFIHGANEQPS